MTALHNAAYAGNVATIATLLEAGADVDARSGDGTTPLHQVGRRCGSRDRPAGG